MKNVKGNFIIKLADQMLNCCFLNVQRILSFIHDFKISNILQLNKKF